MKVLSVIVPAYNMEKWLGDCLASIAPGRSDPAYEVIVVNDGSSDATSRIAHEWQALHPDVFRVIDKPNGQYGSCVNEALKVATGTYVMILDADDMFDASEFRKYLQALATMASEASPPDVVVNDFEWIDVGGRRYRTTCYGLPPMFGMDAILAVAGEISMHALAYRTGLLRDVGYRQTEGQCYTDIEWTTFPMASVRVGRSFPHVLYRYRTGRQGQSVEVASYVRNMNQLERMFESLARFRACRTENADKLQKAYVTEQVKRQALLVACIYFFEVPVRQARLGFDAFFGKVEALSSEAFEAMENKCVFTWSPFPLRYLRLWRRHSFMRLPLMLMLRLYERLVF